MNSMENGDRLNTWKEIADYLDCDPRTCSRWEERYGLPVHRLDDLSKSRVYAYRGELDEWLAAGSSERGGAAAGTRRRRVFKWAGAVSFGLALLAAGAWLAFRSIPADPVDFRVEGPRVIFLDSSGRPLWEHDTGLEKLHTEEHFRSRSKRNVVGLRADLPQLAIEDLDGDGRAEVLLAVDTHNNLYGGGLLRCFDRRGSLLWELDCQRTVSFSEDLITTYAYFKGFVTCDLDADGAREVVVVSAQTRMFPTRLQVVDFRGEPRGEYWNSGRIGDVVTADLDGDGYSELLICGVNNEYRQAFLAVLDGRDIRGGSPQVQARYIGEGIGRGSHLWYVLFPRIEINPTGDILNAAGSILILPSGSIRVCLINGAIFQLGFDLTIQAVNFTSEFDDEYARLKAGGRVDGDLDESYRRKLKAGLLYHDGENWVSFPARNRRRF